MGLGHAQGEWKHKEKSPSDESLGLYLGGNGVSLRQIQASPTLPNALMQPIDLYWFSAKSAPGNVQSNPTKSTPIVYFLVDTMAE
jgi:hypothetical protein